MLDWRREGNSPSNLLLLLLQINACYRPSPHARAWRCIYENSVDQRSLATLRSLFPTDDDESESRKFSKLHQIVLGHDSSGLAEALTHHTILADINVGDSEGMTPLMWAARRGDSIIVDLLLKNGADPNICDQNSHSALLNATRLLSIPCIKLLLQAGADPAQIDNQGFNVLHYMAMYSIDGDIPQCLIDAGADINGRTIENRTPIFCAIYRGKFSSARALLDYGADMEATDMDGDSFFHYSLFFSAHEMLQLLLDRRVSYTSCDSTGGSALHIAAQHGDIKILQILDAANLKGLDPNASNHKGKSPLQLAQEREDAPEGFVEKMQELLSGIRARNHAGQQRSNTNASSANAGGVFLRDRPASFLILHLAVPSQYLARFHAWLRSLDWQTWKPILLYWILGLGWAGFIYKLLEPGHAAQ